MTYETLNDALIDCVKACGGSKVVGAALWPAKGVEVAQRQLLACLNPDRNEKLSPDELLFVLTMARDKGCHVGMQHIASVASYAQPVPVTKEDAADQLKREFIAATNKLAAMAEQIQRLRGVSS
jgi:hypothetical protein